MKRQGAEESLHGEEKPLWKHGLFTSIVPTAKVAYFAKNSSLSFHRKSLAIFLDFSMKPAIQSGEVAISGSHSRQMTKIG